jgi:iron complex outermembrane recepter protein
VRYILLATGLLAGTTVQAQTAAGDPAKPGTQQLEEIVVTAQKRSENINKVPMSISAASGDQLARAGVADTRDLAKISSGFTYADTPVGVPVYTLRGVGFYDQSLASTPAVSIYNDEVPMTFPVMTRGAVLDLERVEVLKGPQGTLFGANATGGAINYIAAKPTPDFRFGLDATYARFGEADIGGFVSGPLTDTLGIRIAARTEQSSEGWQHSLTRDETLGRKDKTLGRIILEWKPDPKLSVRLSVDGWRDRSETQAAQLVGTLLQVPGTTYPIRILSAPRALSDDQSADWSDTPFGVPRRHQDFIQASLRADYRLTDAVTLTSLSAYSHMHENSSFDSDGVNYNAYDYDDTGFLETWYQELRLSGRSDRLTWVVGGNFERDRTNQYTPFLVDGTTSNPAPGYVIDSAIQITDTRASTWAGFANAEYHVLANLSLQGGIRYTDSSQTGGSCGASGGADNNTGAFFDLLSNELSGGLSSPNIQPGQCYTLGPAPTFTPELVSSRLHQHNVSWKAGATWNLAPDLLTYASVGRGYKSGGFPGLPATIYTSSLPYTQETVLAYEVGGKATLFDRRVQVNGAAFYYDYSDKQTLGNYLDAVFGIQPIIVNIPKSRIWGIEGQVAARVLSGLQISASGSYLDSRITDYVGYNTLASYGNQAGTPIPFTPKFTANSDIEYQWALSGALNAFLGGGLTYNSRANAGIGAPAQLTIDPYALLDLRAGIRSADKRWSVTAYGHNVTNTYYWTTALHIQDGIVRYAGMPATYGVTLGYRY